jgi:hypothetical protein
VTVAAMVAAVEMEEEVVVVLVWLWFWPRDFKNLSVCNAASSRPINSRFPRGRRPDLVCVGSMVGFIGWTCMLPTLVSAVI